MTESTRKKIDSLSKMGEWITNFNPSLELACLHAQKENKWFTIQEIRRSLDAIATTMLSKKKLLEWSNNYKLESLSLPSKTVGLILAGNIPLVGFHDLLCAYMSHHNYQIKCSKKDAQLIPALLSYLSSIDPTVKERITHVDKLNDIDAIIATGSDNTKRYFEYYFRGLPQLLRSHRNSIAIVSEDISDDQLKELGKDVFYYYGLGCRSVSQLFVPASFDIKRLFTAWEGYSYLIDNERYANNLQYNYAIYSMNQEDFLTNNVFILREHKDISSRISCVHYQKYQNVTEVSSFIVDYKEAIQVVVTDGPTYSSEVPHVSIGQAQCPGLMDYADHIDTMDFLIKLSYD